VTLLAAASVAAGCGGADKPKGPVGVRLSTSVGAAMQAKLGKGAPKKVTCASTNVAAKRWICEAHKGNGFYTYKVRVKGSSWRGTGVFADISGGRKPRTRALPALTGGL
jgi:hypothetical protein